MGSHSFWYSVAAQHVSFGDVGPHIFWATVSRLGCCELPNCPHKLTKAAERWLGGGAAFGRLQLHARVTSAADRSCRCALVAAAVVPLSGCRHGRRPLQLRVISLGSRERQCCHFARSGTNTMLRRFDRIKKFWSSYASSVRSRPVLGNRILSNSISSSNSGA